MNHREPPHLSAGTRKALHCLALLLVPALAPGGAQAVSRTRPVSASGANFHGVEPAPYLPVRGALALRFQEEPPPPDLTTRPAAAAPPNPALTPTESSVALANAAAARSTSVVTTEPMVPVSTPVAPAAPESVAPPAKTPPAILPDDVRPSVRPEDFLPYFQLPGSNAKSPDVTLLVPAPKTPPAPAPLPASSATYTQSPR